MTSFWKYRLLAEALCGKFAVFANNATSEADDSEIQVKITHLLSGWTPVYPNP